MGHGVGATLFNVGAQCDGTNRVGENRRSGRISQAIEPPIAKGDSSLLAIESCYSPTGSRKPLPPRGSEDDLELKGTLHLINGLTPEALPGLINDVLRSVFTNSGLETFQGDVCLIGIEYREGALL